MILWIKILIDDKRCNDFDAEHEFSHKGLGNLSVSVYTPGSCRGQF